MIQRAALAAILSGAFCTALSAQSASGPAAIGAWARMSPMTGGAGAVYMVLANDSDVADRLLSASSPAAGATEIHETRIAHGMMSMSPIAGLDLPPRSRVELAPGGLHLMLLDLARPLRPGDRIELTLVFEKTGTRTVSAEVRQQ